MKKAEQKEPVRTGLNRKQTMKTGIYYCAVAAAVGLLLLLQAAAWGEEISVFIPGKLSELGLPDMPEYFTLKTETESIGTYGNKDKPDNPCPVLPVEDAEIRLSFSKKPDWAAAVWMDGWENLDVDESGYAETSMEGRRAQPGLEARSGPIDPSTGKPEWRWNDKGDYAFMAGLGPVTCQFGRDGSVQYVEYTAGEDYYRTGMTGAVTVIRWKPISIKNFSERNDIKYETTTTQWVVVSVTASYPAGNPITGVRAEYRSDKKNTLGSYDITYAVSDHETYAITYAPDTATILEEHNYKLFYPVNPHLPSKIFYTNDPNTWEEIPARYMHHYEADEPIYGEYTADGVTYVSGSGDWLDTWYETEHGRQLKKKGLRKVTSFPSPRVIK